MKSQTAKWYECKVRYDRTQDDGSIKAVVENYVVDSLSFSEAEARIIEEMTPYMSGEFDVVGLAIAKYTDVVWAEDEKADKWYKAKVAYITIDEKTNKEKRSTVQMLIQGSSLNNAIDNVDTLMKGTMNDYISVDVHETPYMDVFQHKSE